MADAWQEHEVYCIKMSTLLSEVDGVGAATMHVFRRAGLSTVSDVYHRLDQEARVRQAAHDLAADAGTLESGHWRVLANRCVTVIRRIRSAEATPFCPEHFLCPITHECMTDPVVTRYGDSYERWALETALQLKSEDPLSRRQLTLDDVFPNKALREAIEYYNVHFMRFAVPYRVR
jgi:hypothetical protein